MRLSPPEYIGRTHSVPFDGAHKRTLWELYVFVLRKDRRRERDTKGPAGGIGGGGRRREGEGGQLDYARRDVDEKKYLRC